ncbi:MAG: HAMP domain-containing histidine kinase [Acidobacteriota bacterium]|nr:MAG: HAMP domain-containing histidine kinase [Acidobacteriota bacterium]
MMKFKRPPLMLVLALAMLALLPLLAVLQYHWLGEVSRGERERMKSNLEAGAAQFTRDFDREMRNIYLGFQSGIWTPVEGRQAELAGQFDRWRQSAAHPNLVDQIYQTTGEGDPGLMRFDQSEMRLVETAWPAKLENLRRMVTQIRSAGDSARSVIDDLLKTRLPGIERPAGHQQGTILHFTAGPIDEEIPALILHVSPDLGKGAAIPGPPTYRIVTLNREYIKDVLIPELARRYFSVGEQGDYLVSVVEGRQPSNVIYASDPRQPIDKGDVTKSFLRISLNEPDRMLVTGISRPGGAAVERKRVSISVLQSDIRVSKGDHPQGTNILARSVMSNGAEGPWRLVIKHRSGSLEAAVAGVRRRNLAISFGILVLLGVSVGFIVLGARRAQKLARRQMEFVAGVSHELRTPLAVICSAAENLADGVVENREQTRRYGGLIRDEGRRLSEMVEQALEFAGAQSGRRNYQLRPLQPAAIVEDALNSCRRNLADFEFECRIDEDLPMIQADLPALSRAIQNLINNSIKYSGESRWIGIRATRSGEGLAISVSDRGIGIPGAEFGRIFEPFYRGSEVVSAQIHGNGLGLSLVRHIIESHGGSVTVESRPNQGTTFTIQLPAVDQIEESAADKRTYEQTGFAG